MQGIILRALIQEVSFFSRYTPHWSHDHKCGNLAAATFAEYFYAKAQEGVPLWRLILYLQCHTVSFLPRSQKMCHQSLPLVMSHCVAGTDPLRGGILRPPRSILRCLEPHAIPDQVTAASGTWKRYWGVLLPSPHNDRSCWQAWWEVTRCFWVWHCASRQPPGSDSAFWLQYVSPSSDITLLFHSRLGRTRNKTTSWLLNHLQKPWTPCCRRPCHYL